MIEINSKQNAPGTSRPKIDQTSRKSLVSSLFKNSISDIQTRPMSHGQNKSEELKKPDKKTKIVTRTRPEPEKWYSNPTFATRLLGICVLFVYIERAMLL